MVRTTSPPPATGQAFPPPDRHLDACPVAEWGVFHRATKKSLHVRCTSGQGRLMLYMRTGLLIVDTEQGLRQKVGRGELVRVASGIYADGLDLSGRGEEVHELRVRAHAHRCAHVVSHVSAAVLHGLPVPGADLSEVHFSRRGHGGNDLVGDRRLHASCPPEEWVTEAECIRITNVARTLIDVGRTQPHLAAVAAIDAALHRGLTDPADLVAAFEAELRWTGSPFARKALQHADGRSESPGETWARLALEGLHTGHELQFDVYDEAGQFVARGDGGFPEFGLVWEYDGQGKYEELRRAGVTKEQVLAKQARRQGRLVDLGWKVVRADRDDLPGSERFRGAVASALWAASDPGSTRPRGSYTLKAPLTVDIRDPIQWGAAMREEIADRWRARRSA